jgi:hypothetical protein
VTNQPLVEMLAATLANRGAVVYKPGSTVVRNVKAHDLDGRPLWQSTVRETLKSSYGTVIDRAIKTLNEDNMSAQIVFHSKDTSFTITLYPVFL